MKRPWPRRLRSDRRGATALEYALLMPLLLGVIFVSIEITFILFADATLESAANNVTRVGRIGIKDASGKLIRPTCPQLKDLLVNNLPGWVRSSDLDFNVTVYHADSAPPSTSGQCGSGSSTGAPGDMALYTFGIERTGFTGFIGWVTGGGRMVRAERSILVQNEL
ncbi:TadE/TadG family type IV pilus assembly protein [uncultured Castellaniella sp.]|uniref:TadE/TadG family type IV pilus assembly protein n=1 Tax=uncultured Castellaniella sp. TaxID=647907 RepID=UPI0026066457|nr:TadE/TadG family type IV pilus assembly protein [uncultured Castellaniella sp.]